MHAPFPPTAPDLHHLAVAELPEVASGSGAATVGVLLRDLSEVFLGRDLGPKVHEHVDRLGLQREVVCCMDSGKGKGGSIPHPSMVDRCSLLLCGNKPAKHLVVWIHAFNIAVRQQVRKTARSLHTHVSRGAYVTFPCFVRASAHLSP